MVSVACCRRATSAASSSTAAGNCRHATTRAASDVRLGSKASEAAWLEPDALPAKMKNRVASLAAAGCWAERLISAVVNIPSAASSFWPITSRLLPLCRRKLTDVGSLIATASPNQAHPAAGHSVGLPPASNSLSALLRCGSAGTLPSKTTCGRDIAGWRWAMA